MWIRSYTSISVLFASECLCTDICVFRVSYNVAPIERIINGYSI
ncbi:rCG58890 [Rattus norvegicus]|uniref:RCG58890 n=1 Tax=Rattus norvegicus TaxID=10116 RepID=A6KU99_RAT|nr:rCG58890 [Rattus norvegicus]